MKSLFLLNNINNVKYLINACKNERVKMDKRFPLVPCPLYMIKIAKIMKHVKILKTARYQIYSNLL